VVWRGRPGEEGRNVPDDRAELNRDALRLALAHSESFTFADLLRAFGPLGIDPERTAALAAETGETGEHQRAALALLVALTGLHGYGITRDFEIATRAWTDAHAGLSFSGARIIDELVERADSIAERFGLKPCTVPHPASEFDDPARFRECVNSIRSWATDKLRELGGRDGNAPKPATSRGKKRRRRIREGKNRKHAPRIVVELQKKTVTLDGKTHDVTSERALRWLKVLADRPGEWVSSKGLEGYDPELLQVRTDHLRKYLPAEICSLIDSKTGAGSRLRLPK
jgi:hypothetical protein